jgi:hypothetical protein
MSQATIKKYQTFIFFYIIAIGRGGQSLYFAVHYFQLLAKHHAGLGLQYVYKILLRALYMHVTYLLNDSQGSSNKNAATTML